MLFCSKQVSWRPANLGGQNLKSSALPVRITNSYRHQSDVSLLSAHTNVRQAYKPICSKFSTPLYAKCYCYSSYILVCGEHVKSIWNWWVVSSKGRLYEQLVIVKYCKRLKKRQAERIRDSRLTLLWDVHLDKLFQWAMPVRVDLKLKRSDDSVAIVYNCRAPDPHCFGVCLQDTFYCLFCQIPTLTSLVIRTVFQERQSTSIEVV